MINVDGTYILLLLFKIFVCTHAESRYIFTRANFSKIMLMNEKLQLVDRLKSCSLMVGLVVD